MAKPKKPKADKAKLMAKDSNPANPKAKTQMPQNKGKMGNNKGLDCPPCK